MYKVKGNETNKDRCWVKTQQRFFTFGGLFFRKSSKKIEKVN
jgi:hypothetical protein